MNNQPVKEEEIFLILTEASKWAGNEIEEKLSLHLPSITKFVANVDDPQTVIQVIKFSFESFLPHLQIMSLGERLLDSMLPLLLSNWKSLLNEEGIGEYVALEEKLKGTILGVEICKDLLNNLINSKQFGAPDSSQYALKVPPVVNTIFNLSLEHYMDRELIYRDNLEKGITAILEALLKETVDGCSSYLDFISKIEWVGDDSKIYLSEVFESISKLAHCLSCVSEVKLSVIAWKTFASLIRSHSADIRSLVTLQSTVQYLSQEIQEGFLMLKSFENDGQCKLDANEEKIFDRVVKRTSFLLRILVSIGDKFGGFLRGTHSENLRIILFLLSFSPHGMNLRNLNEECKKKIEEQLAVGVSPFLSQMKQEKSFMKEVVNWLDEAEESFESKEKETCDSMTSPSFTAYLLLLMMIIKETLAEPFRSCEVDVAGPWILRNVLRVFPYCHAELSWPQTLPGVMYGGQAPDKVTVYEYVLVYTCAYVSTLDECQFGEAEQVLFHCVLDRSLWKSLLASDILCFIARYGSPELCEHHCRLLADVLREGGSFSEASMRHCEALLGRLLTFLSPNAQEDFLSKWVQDKTTSKVVVAKVVCSFSSELPEELQSSLDNYILTPQNRSFEDIQSLSSDDTKSLLEYLEAVSYYLKSSSIQIKRTKTSSSLAFVMELLRDIFSRFPSSSCQCSLVARLFCLCLDIARSLIRNWTCEDIHAILVVCEEATQTSSPQVSLQSCQFLASLGVRSFNDSEYEESILSKIEDIFVEVLTQSTDFVRSQSIGALITFAQFSKYEELFASCVKRIPNEVNEEVTRYLQFIPESSPEEGFSAKDYFDRQLENTLRHKENRNFPAFERLTKLPTVKLNDRASDSLSFGSEEQIKNKRRRLEENVEGNDESAILSNVKAIKEAFSSKSAPVIDSVTRSQIKSDLQDILKLLDT